MTETERRAAEAWLEYEEAQAKCDEAEKVFARLFVSAECSMGRVRELAEELNHD